MLADNNSDKLKIELGRLQETLLIPLWARARENKKQKPYLFDPKASEIIRCIDYDFGSLERAFTQGAFGRDHAAIFMIRNKYFDDAIKEFIVVHPKAAVVNIGAGLDTTFYRVDNGSIRWYDLDLPDVIALRRQLSLETDRSKCIAKSVLDFTWFDDIGPEPDGLFLFAGGVLFYRYRWI